MNTILLLIIDFGVCGAALCAVGIVREIQSRDTKSNETAHAIARTNFDEDYAHKT